MHRIKFFIANQARTGDELFPHVNEWLEEAEKREAKIMNIELRQSNYWQELGLLVWYELPKKEDAK